MGIDTMRISLFKVITRNNMNRAIANILEGVSNAISVFDSNGRCLMANITVATTPLEHPIMVREDVDAITLNGEIIGYFTKNRMSDMLSSLLETVCSIEAEKKVLASETLDKYREISFLCDFTTKLSECIDAIELIETVIDETVRYLESSGAAILLIDEVTGELIPQKVFGDGNCVLNSHSSCHSLIDSIHKSDHAEIFNSSDINSNFSCSMLCSPLMLSENRLGLISVCRKSGKPFTSADLKLFVVLASQASAAIGNVLLQEHRIQQLEIRNRLGRYLSPRVVDSIVQARDESLFSTKKQKITMLFSDIRSFSSKCEELSPEEIVSFLNYYFSSLVAEIFNHEGTVNKFVGDMIVAMFGAPEQLENQELCALRAAVGMQKCIAKHPVLWIREHFLTGIGISSGDAVVGNIGAPDHMDYTAIGDEVNIASRLQSLAQGGQILVSRSVYDAVTSQCVEEFEFREFGMISVKGKKIPVEVFEVVY